MELLRSLVASDAQAARGRARRRAYPVHAYVGRNGSGKSWAMVQDTIPDLLAGSPVLSTVRLLDFTDPRPCELSADDCPDFIGHLRGHMQAHPSYVPFTDWPQFRDWDQGPILMDEITGVADSSDASGLPSVVANKLAQLRRSDIVVRYTCLNFVRANKRLREATSAVSRCASMLPKTTVADDGSDRLWKQRRLSIVRTYDAQSLPLDDVSESAWEKADRIVTSRHWIPGSAASLAYDTYDAVATVGTVSDAGRCVNCGGNRRVPECSCSDYQERKPSRASARTARRASAEDRTDSASAPTLVSAMIPGSSCSGGSAAHASSPAGCSCAVA